MGIRDDSGIVKVVVAGGVGEHAMEDESVAFLGDHFAVHLAFIPVHVCTDVVFVDSWITSFWMVIEILGDA